MICSCCDSDYADVDGLCSVCHAEQTFDVSDAEIVESDRARYESTGARLEKKTHDRAVKKKNKQRKRRRNKIKVKQSTVRR